MTRQRKIFWTIVTLAILVGYFALFFWMKSAGVHAKAEDIPAPETQSEALAPAEGALAYFAGGCFWCVEKDFEKLDGVGDVISGFMGGAEENPVYGRLAPGSLHQEAVQVPYDPAIISYRELVDYFFRHIDPLDDGGQFCDRGHEYKTGIWVTNAEERAIAEAAKAQAESELGESVVTPIYDVVPFWQVADYHQDFYKKNPVRYSTYRLGCGRDARVNRVWGK